MSSAIGQEQIQTLIRQLQDKLRSHFPGYAYLEPQGKLRRGVLMVLAQHEAGTLSEPQTALEAIATSLQELRFDILPNWFYPQPVELTSPVSLPVLLYLRRKGERQPYASQRLLLQATPEELLGVSMNHSQSVAPDPLLHSGSEPDVPPADPTPPHPTESSGGLVHSSIESTDATDDDLSPSSRALMESESFEEADDHSSALVKRPQRLQRATPALVVGAVAGIIGIAGAAYMLTRPCVVGSCETLSNAQQLSQSAIDTVQATKSAQAVVDAYDDLVEANYLFSTIPPWSGRYSEAQDLLKRYEADTAMLGQIVDALRTAHQAAVNSQNPPHPLPDWREVQGLWRQAIALLKQIPANSPVYPLVERKLAEYQVNLDSINHRLRIEQETQEKVASARSMAQLAETREGVSRSLQDWQLAHSTWKTVVALLRQVPQTTMAYAEAQQLLAIYQPKLVKVDDRLAQEEISASAYQQALNLAQDAQTNERGQQWSKAVENWRAALNYAQQVPSSTSYYSQAQPLITAYQSALQAAQENLRTAVALDNARPDLDRLCSGTPQICTYSPNPGSIQLRLSADYDQAMEEAIFAVATPEAAAVPSNPDVTNRINSLIWTVATIGGTTRVPIELYRSNGDRFGAYDPDLAGYVRRE